MRRLPLLLPALTCLLSAEAAPLKAPIVRVRLHPDEAWVMRVGRIHLEGPGLHRLELRDLPPGLRLEDLQVSAKGPSGTRLGDVAVKAEVRTVTETPEWRKLEGEKEALRDRQDALEAQRDALRQEEAFLKSLQASHAQELSARMAYTLPQAQSLAEFGRSLQARLAALIQQEKRAQRDLDALKLEQARVQAEMDQRRGQQRTAPSLVTLELTTPAAGFVEVELNYRQSHARWRPVYEARLSEDRKTLGLVLAAAVTQSTGESWAGVKVEISNARPSRGLGLAEFRAPSLVTPATELRTLAKGRDLSGLAFLSPSAAPMEANQAIAGASSTENRMIVDGLDARDSRAGFGSATEAEATLTEEASGLAATWSLEGAKDIPSDGEPHRFRVLSRDLTPELALLAAPRLTSDVQQIVRFEAPANFPLFPHATVTHYAGGQRLGDSQLALPAAGQPFTFGFGPYKPLRVTFKRVDRKEETVGTFSKEHQITLRDLIEVANDGAEALTVEVQDRALKSELDTIKVKALPETTPGFEEKVAGVRTWTVSVPARGKASVAVATEVRAPLNLPLQGLD